MIVREESYSYKKGFSRGNSQSSSSSEAESFLKEKRAKFDSDQRKSEWERISNLLDNLKSHKKIKEARINKEKAIQDYKLCDQLSTEIRQLLKDKGEYERQLSTIERKEKKSSWYRKKSKSKSDADKVPASQTPQPITKLFRPNLEKNDSSGKAKTSSGFDTNTELSSNTLAIPNTVNPVMPTSDVTEASKDVASIPLERSEFNSSHDTLIINSSDKDLIYPQYKQSWGDVSRSLGHIQTRTAKETK